MINENEKQKIKKKWEENEKPKMKKKVKNMKWKGERGKKEKL